MYRSELYAADVWSEKDAWNEAQTWYEGKIERKSGWKGFDMWRVEVIEAVLAWDGNQKRVHTKVTGAERCNGGMHW